MSNENKLSKRQVIEELWRRGSLSFMMDSTQKELYNLFHKSDHKVQTWLLARRSGKTRTLLILALEECIKNKNHIVKFVSPTKGQCQQNVRPLMKEILEDCPDDIKPEYRAKDYIYFFSNGSELQLSGSENGHYQKLRGGNSWISIVDEAGDVTSLDDVVKSVLLPTTLTTNGKILIAGTPPGESDHDFLKFIEDAEMKGSLIKKTVYDNPRLTAHQIEDLILEMGGITSTKCRRELFCEIVQDERTGVLPEFTKELQDKIIKEWPKPPFYDAYESMDLGFNDLTVVLFAYYDFRADKVVVEDEYIINGTDLHLTKLANAIKEKEKDNWSCPYSGETKKPYVRISDINHIVTNEIRVISHNEINFLPAKKDDNDASINNLRVMLANQKIIIHPRCKVLIRHLQNVKWSSPTNKVTFARSPDDGHYDAVDALKYLVRHVVYTKNPYPANYGINLRREDVFVNNPFNFNKDDPAHVYKKIFGRSLKR